MERAGRKTRELYNMGITLTNACIKRMDWFRVGRDLFKRGRTGFGGFKGGRTGFGWFQGGEDWFRLVSAGFVREGLVSGGFGSFHFLVTTFEIYQMRVYINSRSTESVKLTEINRAWSCNVSFFLCTEFWFIDKGHSSYPKRSRKEQTSVFQSG